MRNFRDRDTIIRRFLFFRPSLACLRTVECGYALTACFAPGDRHLMVGLKDGKMLIVDIASGDILEEIAAHSKELWSVILYPDMVSVMGSVNQTIRFFIYSKAIKCLIERCCYRRWRWYCKVLEFRAR